MTETSPGPGGGAGTPRRYPFLPPDSTLGWTPYAWLVYLSFFFIEPLFYDLPPWEVVATGGVVALFLPLYFWGYWQTGWRTALVAFLIALLGAVSAPWNQGAAVFFIYASGYLGWLGSPRRGFLATALLVAWIAAEAWLLDLPWNFWGIGIVFTVLVAGINIHYAEVARRDRALRRSQEEVQRLARVAERERIGRDLHDLLGHTLSLITLKAELAGKLLARSGEAESAAAREVADVERISRRALAEVREAVAGYRSGGLAAELDRAAAALGSAGVEPEREIHPAALARAAADPEVERALAFVLREAVTNVLRHADAGACRIVLALDGGGDAAGGGREGAGDGEAGGERGGATPGAVDRTAAVAAGGGLGRPAGRLRLEVVDDGRGGDGPEGFGLSGMRERLATVGGTLHRDGDRGTRLVATAVLGPRHGERRRDGEQPPRQGAAGGAADGTVGGTVDRTVDGPAGGIAGGGLDRPIPGRHRSTADEVGEGAAEALAAKTGSPGAAAHSGTRGPESDEGPPAGAPSQATGAGRP